jgi:glycosyltransferase involved in cell wall biosynthesis
MKILVVSHEFPPIGGGGANACYFLTKGFAEKGHQVTLITANYQNLPENEQMNGVQIIRVNSKRKHKEHCSFKEMLSYLSKALPAAEQLERKEKFDLCLVFFGIPSGPIGYVLKRKYNLPYVIRFGGGDVPGFQKRFTKVYKILAPAIKAIWRNADALVANSQGLKDMALDFYDKKDFEIICNGVDTKAFYPAGHEASDEFRILFVSRLIERKGLQYIIPDLGKIQADAGRKIKLVVVGDGPYRAHLESLAETNRVSDLVQFVGQKNKEEIVPYYQNADLFILPSAKEGMPNVVLEAMACGLPVIMTPCEGSKELIDQNGKIVETDKFCGEIVALIKEAALGERYGVQSRRIIEEKFTWDITVEEYLKLMQKTVVASHIRFIRPSKKYDIFAKHIRSEGYPVFSFQRFDNGLYNGLSMLARKFLSDRIPRFYDKKLKEYEGTYIIFDALVEMVDLIWLKEKNPRARLIILIWNPVSRTKVDIEKAKELGYEVWSYGKKQCCKYQMKENLYFFCQSMYRKALKQHNKVEYDIVFAGKDKGRLDKINELIKTNYWENLRWKFYFTPDHFWQMFSRKEYQKTLDYEDIQVMQSKAKAIMELMPAKDVDITMRTIDALVLHKKLITDAAEIKSQEYYHPNNVFVIGADDPDSMEEFLEKEYVPIAQEIIDKYRIDAWVERFEKG